MEPEPFASRTRAGLWVRFQDGELAVRDADFGEEGILALQDFIDGMLPSGQQLKALVIGTCQELWGGEGHECSQLAATTRLEFRCCYLQFPVLLRQAPNLRKLVIEHCAIKPQEGDANDDYWLALSCLPAGLQRLSLMNTPVKHPPSFPPMPGAPAGWGACCHYCMGCSRAEDRASRMKPFLGFIKACRTSTAPAALEELSLSCIQLRHLVSLDPSPLSVATSLRRLRVGETEEQYRWQVGKLLPGLVEASLQLIVPDAEALAESLPHLQELELWTYADPRLAAEPGALECLAALMPGLSVRTMVIDS